MYGGDGMSKLTKAQEKRLVRAINSKTKKLFTDTRIHLVSVADMSAIEKLTAKWLKRIG